MEQLTEPGTQVSWQDCSPVPTVVCHVHLWPAVLNTLMQALQLDWALQPAVAETAKAGHTVLEQLVVPAVQVSWQV